jgi:hypothetical protein
MTTLKKSAVISALTLVFATGFLATSAHAQDNTGGGGGQTQGGAAQDDRDDSPDIGWIGLAGLAGLLGLRRKQEVHRHVDAPGTTTR